MPDNPDTIDSRDGIMPTFEIINDENGITTLDGTLLALSSSQRDDSDRWIEFWLYRTDDSERYVLHRIGRSTVYHVLPCRTVNPETAYETDAIGLDDLSPCGVCAPNRKPRLDTVWRESDRYRLRVFEDATGLVDELHRINENGMRYLTNVARRLLNKAAGKDEAIADAFFRERIV